jgi:hypothetical protein
VYSLACKTKGSDSPTPPLKEMYVTKAKTISRFVAPLKFSYKTDSCTSALLSLYRTELVSNQQIVLKMPTSMLHDGKRITRQ